MATATRLALLLATLASSGLRTRSLASVCTLRPIVARLTVHAALVARLARTLREVLGLLGLPLSDPRLLPAGLGSIVGATMVPAAAARGRIATTIRGRL